MGTRASIVSLVKCKSRPTGDEIECGWQCFAISRLDEIDFDCNSYLSRSPIYELYLVKLDALWTIREASN